MDSEQRKRITSNITFLKERLGYLDPILDRLVEKNVLTMEQRERIEKVQPPTPHKKFNEFIQFLLASPGPGTFPAFIASLEEERFFNIVEKLQKDVPGRKTTVARDTYVRPQTSISRPTTAVLTQQTTETNAGVPEKVSRSKTSIYRQPAYHLVDDDTDTLKSESPAPQSPSPISRPKTSSNHDPHYGGAKIADRVTVAVGHMFAEFSGKLTNDLLDGFERRRHEERIDLEIRIEKKIDHVIDKRVDEKLATFKQEWEQEKANYLQGNQKALNALSESIESLQAYQEEYLQLKQKYEQLQHTHSQMREKENERWQKLSVLNKDNNTLKNEGEVLRGQIIELRDRVQELESDNRVLKDNEIQDQCKINQLVADKEDLLAELERTEREKMDLKMRVDTLSREIEKLLNSQQERASQEDKAYQDALRKQNDRLDELYKVVQALSDRDRQTRNLFIGGSTMSKTIRTSARPNK
ncbi:myosin-2-like [Saccostrea cucullata]|uniref:myosin-2-like n=1 Tax=Saccostrea cuccullata TaxID=36930 RepID=UPI002ED58EC3